MRHACACARLQPGSFVACDEDPDINGEDHAGEDVR
jgi:hypothetical protein